MRYLTAGESHGKALVAVLEGCPANLPLSEEDIDRELERRQQGYGRGARMQLETDKVEIISGVRQGKTMGSPIALRLANRSMEFFDQAVTAARPGHADLAGSLKYGQRDIRNILERASARETAAKVALGAIAKKLLSQFKINIFSKVLEIGGKTSEKDWKKAIDAAKEAGDTLGGIFELTVTGCPVGLGSHVHWDRRLSANLARAIMGIPAIKGVEFGQGFEVAAVPGSEAHDEIFFTKDKGYFRKTNHAGGLEGGMTNGEPLILRAAVKPIATLKKPLKSIDIATKKAVEALVERSDVTAVEPAAVIGEAVVALTLAEALVEKFGGDVLDDILASFNHYVGRLMK
ncbi:MAG: chorismate synthase [Candidatus Saganbacteria bacterium]|nr:chorismate synthase [Candidatus Saganbacteria bacterium]